MLTEQTKTNSGRFVTRRRAIEFLGGSLTTSIALGDPPQHGEVATSPRQYALIDALEKHGQWLAFLSWADDIHQSMGAKVWAIARGTASGFDCAATATRVALQRLDLSEHPPDGAVVVVYGRPGVLRMRDVHRAYQIVRSNLPPDAYCAYSPFFREAPEHTTVEVTLGWRNHRNEFLYE